MRSHQGALQPTTQDVIRAKTLPNIPPGRIHKILIGYFLLGALTITALRFVTLQKTTSSLESLDQPYPIIQCQRPPKLDGKLNDKCWAAARSTRYFVNPSTGRPDPASRVQARAWLAWMPSQPTSYLYGLIQVLDANPTSAFSQGDIDPHIWEHASGVELILQPDPKSEADNSHYFEIQIDVHGAVWDSAFDSYNQPRTQGPGGTQFGHQMWRAHIDRVTHVDRLKGLYLVEFKLPLQTIAPVRAGARWRMNIYSFRDGQRDALAWSPLMGEGNFHFTKRFRAVVFE